MVEDDICCICLEQHQNPYETPCKHRFCYNCIHNKNLERIMKVKYCEVSNKEKIIKGVACPLCREFVELVPTPLTCLEQSQWIFIYACQCVAIGICGATGGGIIFGVLYTTRGDTKGGGFETMGLLITIIVSALFCWCVATTREVRRGLRLQQDLEVISLRQP